MNRAILAVLLLLVLGSGAWFVLRADATGVDAAGRDLLARIRTERGRDPVDAEACRDLLVDLRKHPQLALEPDLIRGHAWLQFVLGRSTQALSTLEPNLGVGATSDDQLLGSLILERRFADTGKAAFAHRGATLARAHFDATNDHGSLFRAWQLQVRGRNDTRRAELAALILQTSAASPEARLVKTLVNYPDLREEAAGAEEELRKLESVFPVIPPELDLALAWFELERKDTLDSCLERVERVLRSFQSSPTAKMIGSLVTWRLGDHQRAEAWLNTLIRQFPGHPLTKRWKNMLAAVQADPSRKK